MTSLELRIIAYAITALLLLGGSGFVGYRITANHYERVMALDKEAQDQAVLATQRKAIADLEAQQRATHTAEAEYATLKSQYDDLGSRLADSVRTYAQLRGGIVSATSTAAAAADAAAQGAERTSDLASLVRQTVDAVTSDSAQCAGLQAWARSIRDISQKPADAP